MEDTNPTARACQVPELAPCDAAELVPLVSRLEADEPVTEPLVFPRGTLLPDGRLDLCKQALGPEGARTVAAALRRSTRVSSVLLGADGIGNVGAGAIADLMAENRTITTVFLGCNRIDASGAGKLAAALQDHPTLRALWIKRNPIGAGGAEAIAQALPSARSLRTLDLAQTELDTASGRRGATVSR
jgi:Ran GTPase-activating protein (RanGAP) involved in mRNA processing and transport